MGWEIQDGRRYLYRNRRVGGRPVKEYLSADCPFGEMMADDLARVQRYQAKAMAAVRAIMATDRDRIDGVMAAVGAENATRRPPVRPAPGGPDRPANRRLPVADGRGPPGVRVPTEGALRRCGGWPCRSSR
jgi:hypothetical protein